MCFGTGQHGRRQSQEPAPRPVVSFTADRVRGREFGLQVHDAELLDDVLLAGEAGLLRLRLYAKRCDSQERADRASPVEPAMKTYSRLKTLFSLNPQR